MGNRIGKGKGNDATQDVSLSQFVPPKAPPSLTKPPTISRGSQKNDMSLWGGVVVGTSDFAPAPTKKVRSNTWKWIAAAGGVVGVAIAAFLLIGGDEPAPAKIVAVAPAVAAEKPAEKRAEKPAEKPADKPAEKPAEKPVEAPAASGGSGSAASGSAGSAAVPTVAAVTSVDAITGVAPVIKAKPAAKKKVPARKKTAKATVKKKVVPKKKK
jgi:hypothetical protein